jgi:hypothetical protein
MDWSYIFKILFYKLLGIIKLFFNIHTDFPN